MGNIFKSCRSKKADDEKTLKKNVDPSSQPGSPPFGHQRNYVVDSDVERCDHGQACSASLSNENCLPECDQPSGRTAAHLHTYPGADAMRRPDQKPDFAAEPIISKAVMIQMYTISQPPSYTVVAEQPDKRMDARKGPYQDVVKEIQRKQELQRRSVAEESVQQQRQEPAGIPWEMPTNRDRLSYHLADDFSDKEPGLRQAGSSKRSSKTSDSEEESSLVRTQHRSNYNRYIASLRTLTDVPKKESDRPVCADVCSTQKDASERIPSVQNSSGVIKEEMMAKSVSVHTYRATPETEIAAFNENAAKSCNSQYRNVVHTKSLELSLQKPVFVQESDIFTNKKPVRTQSGKITLGERIRDVIVQDKHRGGSTDSSCSPSPAEEMSDADICRIQMQVIPAPEKQTTYDISGSDVATKKKKVPPPVPPKPKHTSTQTRTVCFADAEISTNLAQLSGTSPAPREGSDNNNCCQNISQQSLTEVKSTKQDSPSDQSQCSSQACSVQIGNDINHSKSNTETSAFDIVAGCFYTDCQAVAAGLFPYADMGRTVSSFSSANSDIWVKKDTVHDTEREAKLYTYLTALQSLKDDIIHDNIIHFDLEHHFNAAGEDVTVDLGRLEAVQCCKDRQGSTEVKDLEMSGSDYARNTEKTQVLAEKNIYDCGNLPSDKGTSYKVTDYSRTVTPTLLQAGLDCRRLHNMPALCDNGRTNTISLFSGANTNSSEVLPCKVEDGFAASAVPSGGESEVPERVRKLEQRQERVLQELETLQHSIESLVKLRGVDLSRTALASSQLASAASAGSVTTPSQPTPLQPGKLHDLVISADPSSVPLSLLVLLKQLAAQVKVLTTTFIHSSATDTPEKLRSFLQNGLAAAGPRSSYQLAISIVWKKLPGGSCHLMVSPTRQSYIEGEANVARYLSRLLRPSYDSGDIAVTTQIDELLDLVQQQILQGNNKERSAALRILNARLGKQQWLIGEGLSLADVVAWSALQSTGLAHEAPTNVKNWLKVCGDSDVFRMAVKFLLS